MVNKVSLIDLVGSYELMPVEARKSGENTMLHIISVDEEEPSAFIDFEAAPEWVSLEKTSEGKILLNSQYLLNTDNYTYTLNI